MITSVKRVNVFLLCLIFIFMAISLPILDFQSNAVFTEAAVAIGQFMVTPPGLSIAAALLVAAGVYFATNEAARNAAVHFLRKTSKEYVSNIVDMALLGTAVVGVSGAMWQETKQKVNEMYPVVGDNNIPASSAYVVDGVEYTNWYEGGTFIGASEEILLPSGQTIKFRWENNPNYPYGHANYGKYYYSYAIVDGVECPLLFYGWGDNGNPDRAVKPYLYYAGGKVKLYYSYTYQYSVSSSVLNGAKAEEIGLTEWEWDTTGVANNAYTATVTASAKDVYDDFPEDIATEDARAVNVLEDYAGATMEQVRSSVLEGTTTVIYEFADIIPVLTLKLGEFTGALGDFKNSLGSLYDWVPYTTRVFILSALSLSIFAVVYKVVRG